jgi:hypothetical protein
MFQGKELMIREASRQSNKRITRIDNEILQGIVLR